MYWCRISEKALSQGSLVNLSASRQEVRVCEGCLLKESVNYFTSLWERSGTDSSFDRGMMQRSPFHCKFPKRKSSCMNDGRQLYFSLFLFVSSCSGCPRVGQIPLYTWVCDVSEVVTDVTEAQTRKIPTSPGFAEVQSALRTWTTLTTWLKSSARWPWRGASYPRTRPLPGKTL